MESNVQIRLSRQLSPSLKTWSLISWVRDWKLALKVWYAMSSVSGNETSSVTGNEGRGEAWDPADLRRERDKSVVG